MYQDSSNWRKDGHSYMARKSHPNQTQENRMSLKIEGRCVAMASYCQGSGNDGTPETLRRRAYWLADTSDMKHVLVHYLDEKVVTE